MGRRHTVARLASSRNIAADEALLILIDAGLDVTSPTEILVGPGLKRARAALRPVPPPESAAISAGSAHSAVEEFEWPVWPSERVEHLDADTVYEVHEALTQAFAGTDDAVDPPGLRDRGALEAALFRPQSEALGYRKYPTVTSSAAALMHSLVLDHPFFNGNKRTGLVALVWFLRLNRRFLLFSEDELYELVVAVAGHTLIPTGFPSSQVADREVLAIDAWIQSHTRAPETGDRLIAWRRLERLLRKHGCEFGTPHDNRIDIAREGRKTQTAFPRRGFEVEPGSVTKIRQDLGLTEDFGCDSAEFYSPGGPTAKTAQDIIGRYKGVLQRLAAYDRGEVLQEPTLR